MDLLTFLLILIILSAVSGGFYIGNKFSISSPS